MTLPAITEETVVDDSAQVEDEESTAAPLTYAISSYGADYPVDSLVRRIRSGDIFIPSFQRHYVWKLAQASRLIESLLLGLPVPGVFLSREDDTNRLLVIDGQQRLETLRRFYDGEYDGREFRLKNVQAAYENKTYSDLSEEDRRKLDDSIIHMTVVKQESPASDKSSIYHIFERLNTGGTPLTPQQIRNALFHGRPLVDLLDRLNEIPEWRQVIGSVSPAAKDRELILRFLALSSDDQRYAAPMKGFLNQFMQANADAPPHLRELMQQRFADTIRLVRECIGYRAFRPSGPFNAAVFDAVMVGIARMLAAGIRPECQAVASAYDRLLGNYHFQSAYRSGTASADSVRARIVLATESFAAL